MQICTDAFARPAGSLIWNFSVHYAGYGGASQCLFKTFCGIRPFAMIKLPLPDLTRCGMGCWPEGVGRTRGAHLSWPCKQSPFSAVVPKRHGAGHRRHETSVSWLPGTDSAAPAPLACHWNWPTCIALHCIASPGIAAKDG